MKKTIAILSIFIAACSSRTDYIRKPNDTTRTVALYLLQTGAKCTDVYRVEKDSLTFDTTGSEDVIKKRWRRDTLYYVPEITSLVDSSGHPLLDSSKNPKTIIQYRLVDKTDILIDFKRKL